MAVAHNQEAALTLSFFFALAAVCMAAVNILDVAAGITIIIILACVIAVMAYIWAQTFRVAERMRYKAPSIVRRASSLVPRGSHAVPPNSSLAPAPSPGLKAHPEEVAAPVAKIV